MSSAFLYPVFLSLKDATCLIAGFGSVGRRKLAGLIPCAPFSISIFDPVAKPPADSGPNIFFYNRPCSREDIKHSSLVFACADEIENARIADICREMKIWCDSASSPDRGSFIVPAVVRAGDLAAAISTSGGSPALARKMKTRIQDWLNTFSKTATLMKELRPLIMEEIAEQGEREKIFYKLIDSPVPHLLESDSPPDRSLCIEYLASMLPFLGRDRLSRIIGRL